MCTPQAMGGAQAGLGMIGNIMNFVGIQSAHHAAAQAANLNYNMKAEQLDRQNVQVGQQQTEDNLTSAVKYAQSFGRIATSASALGLGGYSSSQLLDASAAGFNRRTGIEDRNADQTRANLGTELRGASLERSSAMANAPRTNLGVLALSMAKSAVGGATTYADLGGKFGMVPQGQPGPNSKYGMDEL